MRALPWIRVDVDMPDHPKMARLADLLGVTEAWPRVFQLWCYAARVAPLGDLGALPPRALAKASGWRGSPPRLVEALLEVGLIEKSGDGYVIHDWMDQQGKYVKTLEKDRERKRRLAAEAAQIPVESARNSGGSSGGIPAPRGRARAAANDTERDVDEEQEQEPHAAVADVAPSESGGQLPLLGGTVPVPDAHPRPPEPAPRPRAPRAGADDAAPPGESGPPPELGAGEPAGSGADVAARRAERAQLKSDFDRWVVPARKLLGLEPADAPSSSAWHQFAGAKGRKGARDRYGIDALLRALDGLAGDTFSSEAGLPALLSNALIQKGLSRAKKRDGGGSPPPAPAAPAAPLPAPGERAPAPWGRR